MNDPLTRANSFLTFKIGAEDFGIQVNNVLNILELQHITEIPQSPDYMKGVINLRGRALPVVDTRTKLGMSPTEFTMHTCIIVLELYLGENKIQIGALVDFVNAVEEFSNDIIDASPSLGNKYSSEFITGIAKLNDKFIMIMDFEKLFSINETLHIQEIKETI